MKAFINGAASVSPQNSNDYETFCEQIFEHQSIFAKTLNPSYKEYFSAGEARRMSTIVKNSIVAADKVLKQSNIEMPDAISVGTGLGIFSDTENFLEKMIENQEKFLTPTSFIQSTHNTVAGQIALRIKCHNENFTYVHRGFSFESAVADAIMHIREGKKNIIVGGVDEMTENYYKIITKTDSWKKEPVKNTEIFQYKTPGAYCGQSQTFFMLSDSKTSSSIAKINDIKIFFKPENTSEIKNRINVFLSHNMMQLSDIDMVILGVNGDYDTDKVFYDIQNDMFMDKYVTYYKHLVGESHTAVAFAVWLAANAIFFNKTPDFISLLNRKPDNIKNVLIYNNYLNANHSLFLLSNS